MPEVSIIIRAKNEEALIGRTLEMIGRQTYRDFEIVIVDSGSTDRTLEIARQHTSLITEIPAEDFTFGYSLNVGCQRASGKYAVLVSAHAVPTDDHWLLHLVDPFRDDGVAATWGSEHGWADSRDTLPQTRSQRVTLNLSNYGPHNATWGFNAANAAIRLDLWRANPFDNLLPASEDKQWAWNQIQNGYSIVYVPESSVYHTHRLTLGQTYRRAWREHRAVAEFMPEIEFGLWDVVKGVSRRPRAGLWKEANSAGSDGAGASQSLIRYAGFLGFRLACRFMFYWGLYRGLKDGRKAMAARLIGQSR